MTRRLFPAAVTALLLTVAACGGSSDGAESPQSTVAAEPAVSAAPSANTEASAESTPTAESTPPPAPTSGESVLARVEEAGAVRIGVRNDNPPMSFIDDAGEWIGFDLELAAAIAEQLGVELELVPVDGTTRISFLESGQVDMSVASMNHTRSRDETIDFSVTYFWDNQSFLVRTDAYESIDDLFGAKVAASAGSSTIDSWTGYVEAAGGDAPEIIEFEDKQAAVQAVRDGAVEGYTEDNITLLSLAAGDPELTVLPGGHNKVQFGVGVPENQSDWLDRVNTALQELWSSGDYQAIYDKWFVAPDTRIIDLPLGGAMEVWK